MKKIICAVCVGLLWASAALAEGCGNGGGTVIVGLDGTRYCKSNITMNWWSAFAWCDAAGGSLIDMTRECNKVTGETGCPNLTGVGGNQSVWTKNVPNSSYAYNVNLSSGAVSNYTRYANSYALCE
ncbi:MAG: hypothetical protein IJV07_01040 [Alphaproteobacteria bacterium]|nr:hypothetical protein [Alphaproteobacteria bacterium]